MSIKKRLFLSNAAMILAPIIVIIFIGFLLHIVFFNGFGNSKGGFKENWNTKDSALTRVYDALQKTASLDPDRLYEEKYLKSLTDQLHKQKAEIIIRKDDKILFHSNRQMTITKNDLPNFGVKASFPNESWVGNGHYATKQYDFYFKDSSKGSIFLIESSAPFVKFVRSFFPILFIGLILLFVLTNVILSTFVSRSILRPVRLLSEGAEKIRNGDLNFHMASKSPDELGTLVNSFDLMRGQLKESMELRDKYEFNRKEMVANISHDLKTPITSILGYVEGIQDGVAKSAQKQKEYLTTIHTKALYVNRLIDELSLFSKLDVKKLPFHFETVDIYAFIQDYLNDIHEELDEKGMKATFDPVDGYMKVCMDRDKIVRVLENIIFNSVKYMNRESGILTISVREQEKNVKVSISDNGPGVSEDDIPTIFDRFYRTDPSRSTAGSGLGLAISSQIIKAHGGDIWAENLPTGGLCVQFTLKKSKDEENEQKNINY